MKIKGIFTLLFALPAVLLVGLATTGVFAQESGSAIASKTGGLTSLTGHMK